MIWFTSSTSFWSSFDNGTSLKSSWPILIISWESWPWYIKEMSHYNTIWYIQEMCHYNTIWYIQEMRHVNVVYSSQASPQLFFHTTVRLKWRNVSWFLFLNCSLCGGCSQWPSCLDENQFSNLWLVCAKRCKKVDYVKESEMKNKLTGDFGLFRKTFFDLFRGYL